MFLQCRACAIVTVLTVLQRYLPDPLDFPGRPQPRTYEFGSLDCFILLLARYIKLIPALQFSPPDTIQSIFLCKSEKKLEMADMTEVSAVERPQ